MWLLPVSVLLVSVVIAVPLGRYLAWIMDGRYHAPRLLKWWEERVDSGPQNWKQYTVALLVFNSVLYAFGYLVLALQPAANGPTTIVCCFGWPLSVVPIAAGSRVET
jgi:potassium-transporting ATPase potassium-binding subunit